MPKLAHVINASGFVTPTNEDPIENLHVYTHEVNIALHGEQNWSEYEDDEVIRTKTREVARVFYIAAQNAYANDRLNVAAVFLDRVAALTGSYGLSACQEAWSAVDVIAKDLYEAAVKREREVYKENLRRRQ